MSATSLPEPFTDLEPMAAVWALATETERNQQRLSSPMGRIQAFYDTMLPRMEAVLTYLSAFPPERAGRAARRGSAALIPGPGYG